MKDNIQKKFNMFRNLGFGFSVYGFLVAMLQLFPNIIWAIFPPTPSRLDNNVSSFLFVEWGEHILGVLIVILLVLLVNKTSEKKIPRNGWTVASFVLIALYWLCWVLYFFGIQNNVVIYFMVILPPVAFLVTGIAEKVYPISVISAIFLIFHLTTALENFPLW